MILQCKITGHPRTGVPTGNLQIPICRSVGLGEKYGKWQNTALCPKKVTEILFKKVKLEWKNLVGCDILSNGNMSSLYTEAYKEQFSW